MAESREDFEARMAMLARLAYYARYEPGDERSDTHALTCRLLGLLRDRGWVRSGDGYEAPDGREACVGEAVQWAWRVDRAERTVAL